MSTDNEINELKAQIKALQDQVNTSERLSRLYLDNVLTIFVVVSCLFFWFFFFHFIFRPHTP